MRLGQGNKFAGSTTLCPFIENHCGLLEFNIDSKHELKYFSIVTGYGRSCFCWAENYGKSGTDLNKNCRAVVRANKEKK